MISIFIFHRCLNRDHAGQILLSLSSAMFAMNLLFVISSLKPYANYGHSSCIAIGALLHYFTLSSLLWMGVEAGNMYQMLVNVFASTEKYFMAKRYLAAWGMIA